MTLTRDDGFALIDVLVVIMIVAIVAMMAVPSISSVSDESRLRAASREFVSALDYARTLAIRYQRPFAVGVPGGNRFMVYDLACASDTSAHLDAKPPVAAYGVVFSPADRAPYDLDFDDEPRFEGTDLTALNGINEVLFYPNGQGMGMDARYAVALKSNTKRVITVAGFTGRVTVAE